MTKRIFIAVNLPEKTRAKLVELLDAMPKEGLKAIPAENLHITLKFLGYVDDEYIEEIKEKLQKISEENSFEIELAGVGEFNSRVIWAGISKNAQMLRDMSGEINYLLGTEEDEFRAHITLARNRDAPAAKIKEAVDRLKKFNFQEKFAVESIDIMESRLAPSGPAYQVLHRIPLKSPGN